MRLSALENEIVHRVLHKADPYGRIYLFGSRTDDAKKGGDIDLFIQTSLVDAAEISKAHTRFLAKLYAELGEQKIDVVIDYPSRTVQLPIFAIALEQGIIL